MSSRTAVKSPRTGAPRPSSAARPTIDRFEQRRKAGRRRKVLLIAVGVLVVVLVALAVWAIWFSRLFAVSTVEVVGAHRLTTAQVEAAAQVPMGRPVLRVDTGSIQGRVAGLTAVSSVVVTTQWPHAVRIAVVERQPVAVVRVLGGELRLIDPDGVDLGAVSTRPAGLTLLSMNQATSDPAAFRATASVAAALSPALAAKVRWISAQTPDSVLLQLSSGATVRWGDASQGAIKAKVLAALMKRQAAVYDVSAPYAPTTSRG